uniref:Uncharacterized protein n=1 Tax=Glossina austeni TaxID=7395 RepID=A0A1A9VF73_GLOAU
MRFLWRFVFLRRDFKPVHKRLLQQSRGIYENFWLLENVPISQVQKPIRKYAYLQDIKRDYYSSCLVILWISSSCCSIPRIGVRPITPPGDPGEIRIGGTFITTSDNTVTDLVLSNAKESPAIDRGDEAYPEDQAVRVSEMESAVELAVWLADLTAKSPSLV